MAGRVVSPVASVVMRTIVCALFVTLLTFGAAQADTGKRTLTLEDIARMRSVAEVSVSPNGEWVAFTAYRYPNPLVDDDGTAFRELFISDRSGIVRPFVTGEVEVSKIDWSPDGSLISYRIKDEDGNESSLYGIPIDGGAARELVSMSETVKGYTWSPDGRKMALLSVEPRPEPDREFRDKGFDQVVYEESKRFVRVWIADPFDSTSIPRKLDLRGSASSLTWSPDGSLLAMALAPTPLVDDSYMERKITLVSPETGSIVRSYDNPGKLGQFAFSPDGSRIAAISGININDPREGSLYLLSTNSDEMRLLVSNATSDSYDGHISSVGWFDNRTIAYMSGVHTGSELGFCRLTRDLEVSLERIPWEGAVFHSMQMRPGSRYAALRASAAEHPSEAYLWDTESGSVTRLSNSNPWLSEIRFARQETITFEARDGLVLEGILIHPLDGQEGKQYPLIMSVHGGPESHVQDGWLNWYSSPGHVAAARGFAVFHPNYRGSTGRGVAFSKLGQGAYAEGEFNDIVDAKNHLVESGLIDPARVGVTGRSYGGFATAWCSTALSEHFAAGVMGVGVSDLLSKFGTTDIPNEMYLVHAMSWPWDRWQWYLEQSPIYHADKSRTPLLILHGKKDPRVHYGQSLELYRYLKTHGNSPVRLVLYPHEEHGTRRSAARYDSSLRLMRWFEHYLNGDGGDPPSYELDYSVLKPQQTPESVNLGAGE